MAPDPGTSTRPSGGGAGRGLAGCGPARRELRRFGASDGSVRVRASSRCAHRSCPRGASTTPARVGRQSTRPATGPSRSRSHRVAAWSDQPQNVFSKRWQRIAQRRVRCGCRQLSRLRRRLTTDRLRVRPVVPPPSRRCSAAPLLARGWDAQTTRPGCCRGRERRQGVRAQSL